MQGGSHKASLSTGPGGDHMMSTAGTSDIAKALHERTTLRGNVGSRPSDHYFRSICLSVCLFVQSFSQPSLIRFRSNLAICYMSGSSCVP